jgi:hypothetical protein
MVAWLKRELPKNYLLEFDVNFADRQKGLAIVFFSARGKEGQSIFDPSLKKRDGNFNQYINGDINNYHISYWAGGRGSANVRKNAGFHLTAIGQDLICTGKKGSYQTVRVYKRGGKIRLTVDDMLAVALDDDGKTYGPVHDHPGWIGLRQMGHSTWGKYDSLRVYPLKRQGTNHSSAVPRVPPLSRYILMVSWCNGDMASLSVARDGAKPECG